MNFEFIVSNKASHHCYIKAFASNYPLSSREEKEKGRKNLPTIYLFICLFRRFEFYCSKKILKLVTFNFFIKITCQFEL